MKKYIKLFATIDEEIEKNPDLHMEQFFYSEGVKPELISQIENDFAVTFTDTAKSFYLECNDICVDWSYTGNTNSGELTTGKIRIIDLEKAFYGPHNKNWENDIWTEGMNAREKEMRVLLKPFDYFDSDDSGCACFNIGYGKIGENIELHSVDYGLSNMKCDFEKYLELVIKTRGYYRWQFLYSNLVPAQLKEYKKKAVADLKKIFNVKL